MGLFDKLIGKTEKKKKPIKVRAVSPKKVKPIKKISQKKRQIKPAKQKKPEKKAAKKAITHRKIVSKPHKKASIPEKAKPVQHNIAKKAKPRPKAVWRHSNSFKGFQRKPLPAKKVTAQVYEEEGVIVKLNVPSEKPGEQQEKEALTPIDIEDVKKAIHEAVAKDMEDIEKEFSSKKTCIVCGAEAQYSIKARPKDTYCRECALEYFKSLNYLERL